jgi:hypothetical protein
MDGEISGILFVLCAALAIIVIIVLAWQAEIKRSTALARLAREFGMRFSREKDRALARRFEDLKGLGEGGNHYAWNVLSGPYEGQELITFDYHYETHSTDSDGNSQTNHHYRHVVALRLPIPLPNLVLAPEDIFSKIAQAFGYDDIDFESAEFSRLYCVRSTDKKFAYDFFNARMIEFLLSEPDRLHLEVSADMLAFVYDGRMAPDKLPPKFDRACSIRERIPDYLFS